MFKLHHLFLFFILSCLFLAAERRSCFLTGDYEEVHWSDGTVSCHWEEICYYDYGRRIEGVHIVDDCQSVPTVQSPW